LPRLHLTVLTTETKPNVCENGFPSLKTWILCLQFWAGFLSSSQTIYCAPWQHENAFIQAFSSVPCCQTCMCKRGISDYYFIIFVPSKNIFQILSLYLN